jgi:hypothetical protein
MNHLVIDRCIGYIASRGLLKDNQTLGSVLKKNVEEGQAIKVQENSLKKEKWAGSVYLQSM